jgi:hypothetical protein
MTATKILKLYKPYLIDLIIGMLIIIEENFVFLYEKQKKMILQKQKNKIVKKMVGNGFMIVVILFGILKIQFNIVFTSFYSSQKTC